MKKKNKEPFIFTVPIWRCEIALFYDWTKEEIEKKLSEIGEGWYSPGETSNGECFTTKGGGICIFVRSGRTPFEMFMTLNHEIVHATNYLLNVKAGVALSKESDEAYAYTNEYIQEQIYKYLKIDEKIK